MGSDNRKEIVEAGVDGQALREVMRRVPSIVTIVTAAQGELLRGITIGSFASTSLEPPLVSFNVHLEAQMYPLLASEVYFSVHLLREDQAYLANHFAAPDLSGDEQFEAVSYHIGAYGTPVLDDAMAVLHCRRYALYDAGDHAIVLGRVVDIDRPSDGNPLIYHQRSYRRVGEAIEDLFPPVKRMSSDTP